VRRATRGPGRVRDEIAEIVTDAYRTVAPKRLVAELDRGRSSRGG